MKDLIIDNTEIRIDDNGYFCVNDLHKASGGLSADRPTYWLQTKQAKELILLINSIDGKPSILKKQGLGTFVAKQLVYSYAMWLSSEFALRVINTFDAVIANQLQMSQSDAEMLRLTRISPNTLKAITGNRSNNEVRKGYIGLTQGGYLVDAGKWVWKHNYQPTEKGLECVKAVKHGVLHFKPEYHNALMETVASYKAQLTNNNADLFLET